MTQDSVVSFEDRIEVASRSALDELLREGAQRMLQSAVENEVAEYIAAHAALRDGAGHRLVVRNGHLPEREIHCGVGRLRVTKPRVRDGREGHRFTSKILPPFMRRVPSIDALIPILYLKGIATGDFGDALESILGPNAPGLSATNIVRLKEGWQKDYEAWNTRDLSDKRVPLGRRYLFQRALDAGAAVHARVDGNLGRRTKRTCRGL